MRQRVVEATRRKKGQGLATARGSAQLKIREEIEDASGPSRDADTCRASSTERHCQDGSDCVPGCTMSGWEETLWCSEAEQEWPCAWPPEALVGMIWEGPTLVKGGKERLGKNLTPLR